MAKITIIGGSGFIGTELIQKLKNVHSVINLDKSTGKSHMEITLIADVRNEESLRNAMPADTDIVVLLAAEHKDDVSPISLYYDVNVTGTENVLRVMDEKGIKRIIFTSSVAIYGLDKNEPDETHPEDPFNHYGKSKWQAEEVLREWFGRDKTARSLVVIRPTVVFGPNNKGNVYNLLRQIAHGKFLMIGNGANKKSMAFVDNIASFISFCTTQFGQGYHLFNYADKPDLSTKELVKQAEISLGKKIAPVRIPYFMGYAGGIVLDVFAKLLNRKFPISAIRIKKFCATTQFSATKVAETGFKPQYSLKQGLDLTIKNIITAEKK